MKTWAISKPEPEPVVVSCPEHEAMDSLCVKLSGQGYVLLAAPELESLLTADDACSLSGWADFQDSWHRLEQDRYMADGGSYRFRRHAVYRVRAANGIERQAHQPHYQSRAYNGLNGGILRHFAPIEPVIAESEVMAAMLQLCWRVFSRLQPLADWHVEVHQFRIVASQTQAMPTPEGLHRDGVSYVFMVLVDRIHVLDGSSGIYDLQQQELMRYTLSTPLEAAIVDDERVMHAVTPILATDAAKPAYRDMLVITFGRV